MGHHLEDFSPNVMNTVNIYVLVYLNCKFYGLIVFVFSCVVSITGGISSEIIYHTNTLHFDKCSYHPGDQILPATLKD